MSETLKIKITLEWRVIALAAMLMPVLLSLGFWQLDRADEKRRLQALYAERQQLGPVNIEQLNPADDLRYQPVALHGDFIEDKHLFLDNRIYQGQFGYEVVTPFLLADSEQIVLVNRGWIAGDKSRRSLPDIESIDQRLRLTGEIYVPHGKMMTLASEPVTDWPRVQQNVDVDVIQDDFDLPVFPYTVRLQQGSPGALQPSWVVVNLQPEKHVGYAVQWFAMSLMLVLIVVFANTNIWALMKGER